MWRVQFLVGKLRPSKPWGMIKKRKKVPCSLAASVPLPPFYTPILAALVLFLQRITNKFLSSPVCVCVCVCVCASSVAQLGPTLCDPTDCSPPGSSVPEIFWGRILEQVDISSSRGSSQPRDQTCTSCDSSIGRQILYYCASWESPSSHEELLKAFLIVLHSRAWFSPQMASAYIFPSTGSPSLQICRLILK